jgi:hypothetical protein
MHVTRRKSGLATGSASATTIDATGGTVTEVSLNPMVELEVSRVELPYVTRDVQGRTQFATQTFGTASSPLPKTQILTVSGPELDTFLPNELFDTQYIASTDLRGYLLRKLPALRQWFEKYGTNPVGSTWPGGVTASRITFWSNGEGGTIYNFNIPNAVLSESGTPVLFGKDLSQDPEPWMIEQYGLIQASLTGGLWGSWQPYPETRYTEKGVAFHNIFSDQYWTSGVDPYTVVTAGRIIDEPIIVWLVPTGTTIPSSITGTVGTYSGGVTINLGSSASSENDFYNGWEITWTRTVQRKSVILDYNGTTKVATVSGNYSSSALPIPGSTYTLDRGIAYRAADYTFIAPPAGLAQFLKESQDFQPYEGQISTVEQDVGGTRYRGTKVSVTNSLSEYSSMAALVAAESLDIKSGTTTISLGQPPRYDYRTLVDRIRKTSQDNIVYVS